VKDADLFTVYLLIVVFCKAFFLNAHKILKKITMQRHVGLLLRCPFSKYFGFWLFAFKLVTNVLVSIKVECLYV